MNRVGQNRETNEEHNEDCGKVLVWRMVLSMFEMDQNWNNLGPVKAVHSLKTIFFNIFVICYFEYMRLLKCAIFYIE